jgi:hypothetical protein
MPHDNEASYLFHESKSIEIMQKLRDESNLTTSGLNTKKKYFEKK